MAKLTKTKPRANRRQAANISLRTKTPRGSRQPGTSGNKTPGTKSSSRSAAPADLRTQVRQILKGLAKAYPDAICALKHESAYELLSATILSAQCTDERVNMVTPVLFAKYPNVESLAAATQPDVEAIIRSTGFFRAKANSLRGMAQGVMERFGGQIPKSLDDLVTLPGVGRKTANVVLGTVWGIPSGVVVDTHVKRITYLLGLTKSTSPEQIERVMMEIIPQSEWVNFSHRLIHHGRRICIARRPKCPECPLLSCCRRVGLPPLQ